MVGYPGRFQIRDHPGPCITAVPGVESLEQEPGTGLKRASLRTGKNAHQGKEEQISEQDKDWIRTKRGSGQGVLSASL